LSKKKLKSESAPAGDGGPMDIAVLEKLVKLMKANELSCVEVADGDRRILLKRGGEANYVSAPAPASMAAPSKAAAIEAPPSEDAGLIPIKAIMVGTFYAAASPDSAPFVKVGTVVDAETDVCVIEAMKVFNTIKAECKGTIAKIIAVNGHAVEFGQTLFLVKP
jgi:acetyl-CoA carboxylase biotin carboxyl carrier protein